MTIIDSQVHAMRRTLRSDPGTLTRCRSSGPAFAAMP